MELNELSAISPIDGRYGGKTAPLREIFSEYGLMRYRTLVEVRWLEALAAHPGLPESPELSHDAQAYLEGIAAGFSAADADRIKAIERRTNHDVKAVEYYLRERCSEHAELAGATQFLHFACTSEDINNLCHALMLRDARRLHLLPACLDLGRDLTTLAESQAGQPMLSRTHGQAATPTTLGKEIGVFVHRLQRQIEQLIAQPLLGKLNGAVGNYNAHLIACPDLDWPKLSRTFVESLGLDWNPHTTQIESHDYLAEYFHALCRINTVLLDLCRDLWAYISLGYFRQRPVAGEIGSSTMPHKINPIDFENAEGNLGLANSILGHLAEKLPISRWQRDLSDSTAIRSIGTAIAHSLLAIQSCRKGLAKLEAMPERLEADLADAWEVLAEAVQTIMRRRGAGDAYETLKNLTRGRALSREAMHEFIASLELPDSDRQRLLELTPRGYTGNAESQARQICARFAKLVHTQNEPDPPET
jgi:adenylosuccinate lyase